MVFLVFLVDLSDLSVWLFLYKSNSDKSSQQRGHQGGEPLGEVLTPVKMGLTPVKMRLTPVKIIVNPGRNGGFSCVFGWFT